MNDQSITRKIISNDFFQITLTFILLITAAKLHVNWRYNCLIENRKYTAVRAVEVGIRQMQCEYEIGGVKYKCSPNVPFKNHKDEGKYFLLVYCPDYPKTNYFVFWGTQIDSCQYGKEVIFSEAEDMRMFKKVDKIKL